MLLASLMKVVMRKTLLAALLNTDMSVHYNSYPQPMLRQEQYIKPLGILGIACHWRTVTPTKAARHPLHMHLEPPTAPCGWKSMLTY